MHRQSLTKALSNNTEHRFVSYAYERPDVALWNFIKFHHDSVHHFITPHNPETIQSSHAREHVLLPGCRPVTAFSPVQPFTRERTSLSYTVTCISTACTHLMSNAGLVLATIGVDSVPVRVEKCFRHCHAPLRVVIAALDAHKQHDGIFIYDTHMQWIQVWCFSSLAYIVPTVHTPVIEDTVEKQAYRDPAFGMQLGLKLSCAPNHVLR